MISKISSRKAQFCHIYYNSLVHAFDKPVEFKIKLKIFKKGIVNNFKSFDSLSMNNEEWKANIKNNINKKVN